jgi:predicted MFS family arabinose efflux permease
VSSAAPLAARRRLSPEWLLIGFLWGCYVLNHADRQVVYTLFPALQKEFGYSDAVVGLTGALFLWVYGLCSPIAGILGDRFSKSKLITLSLGIWSTFTVLSGLSPNGTFLLVCRGLLGVSESMFMPAAYALMAAAHGPETRSRAVGIFGTSQLVGVAVGGSLSGFVAERLHWRASFWILGTVGILFTWPLWRFLSRMPLNFSENKGTEKARLRTFIGLLRIPSLGVVTLFVAVATFGLFLVYTWLPTFLYDKFHLGLARAGFEASVYPQIGTAAGLLVGTSLADFYFRRTKASRFWVIAAALFGATPCLLLVGASGTLDGTRLAAIGFGFFAGFISGNQAPAAFEVVPASLRASAVGVLNLLGASVSGFAPFLGGLARRTIGVDRLMTLTSGVYVVTACVVIWGTLRFFARDYGRAQEGLPNSVT